METLNILFYPFILILDQIFTFLTIPFFNYPIMAILFFSGFISSALKPLQAPLRKIEASTTAKINLIEEEFQKLSVDMTHEEKFYLRDELYKKHSYNPFHSIKQAASFFALIPFLISVILVFENSDFLLNSNVYGIALSQPDGLFFGFNLLPIIMFLSTYLDSRIRYSKDSSSRNKFLVISCVLFFLVYDLSSALIIFWIFLNFFNMIYFYGFKSNETIS